jgi:uncharacterized membrane protein YGL010W
MRLATRTVLTVLLAAVTLFYISFIVPIWVIGQGMAGAPIFELRQPALSVEIAGLVLIGLWFFLVRWMRGAAIQP